MRCNIPARDLSQKLNQTICMYKGKAVWVQIEGGQIRAYDLPKQNNVKVISQEDPDFDISTPPLGYVNYQNRVYYLTRSPIRRSRQGLDLRSLYVTPLGADHTGPVKKRAMAPERIVFNPPFIDMVEENYKTLDAALKELRAKSKKDPEGTFEIAVMRNIALRINSLGIINVFYKNDLVGWIAPESGTVNVPNNQKGWVVSRFLSHVLDWRVN